MRINNQATVLLRMAVMIATFLGHSFLGHLVQGDLARGAESPESITQIRKASSRYVEALQCGDLEAIINSWTPTGTFVDAADQAHQAQQLARQEFSQDAARPVEREVARHQSMIRLVTPDVAIEQGGTGPTSSDGSASSQTSFIAIWVKINDVWLLDHLKEWDVATPSENGHLNELGWMVGQWDCESEGTVARLTVHWSDQKQFLIQRFTVQTPGQPELRGEQRIGWDASSRQIRSWLFRSDGGFVEGAWNREQDTWVVRKSGVMPDGEKTSMVNFWAHEDPDTCWFKSFNIKVGDLKVDDVILQFTRTNSP